MINTKDQEELFKLIANYLEKDIQCIAIGGTAMMFLGYKTTTKDIDIVFANEHDRNIFEKAIEQLGYKQRSLLDVYDEKRRSNTHKPRMYTRGEERFDLFVKNVFGFELNMQKNNIVARYDFLGKKELIVLVVPKEELILLKAITGREKDYEDIETIIKIEKNIDWSNIIEKAIQQKKRNKWILIDLEQTMQQLKKITFIPSKHFKRIYNEDK